MEFFRSIYELTRQVRDELYTWGCGMTRGGFIVGLDIGTYKVTAVVAEIGSDDQINVIGLGECPSTGLRKGIIVDIENTASSIVEALEKAEQMSGVEITSGWVGISGPHISSLNNRGVIAVSGRDKEISVEDVHRVLQAARLVSLPADRQIIHVLAREFIVDGNSGIVDPVGMAGMRLEVETQIVTAAGTALQNRLKSLERAGLRLEEFVLSPLASAEAVLLPAEKQLGAVMVDIGGGVTEIAIYDQGGLWFTSVLPLGGEHITSDLAVGLRTPLEKAEEIKKEYGCVLPSLMPDEEEVDVSSISGQESHLVSRKSIATIIEPRIKEILSHIKKEIERSGYPGILPGGVVLTGGTSLLAGIAELAREELELPVRIGAPDYITGMRDIVNLPQYSTCIGLIMFGAKNRSKSSSKNKILEKTAWGGLKDTVSSWFRDLF